MKQHVYFNVVREIDLLPFDFQACQSALLDKFPGENPKTLKGIVSQQYQKKIKKTYRLFSSENKKAKAFRDYKDLVGQGQEVGVICQIARRNRFSAALTAKFIVEEWIHERTGKRPSKGNLSELTKSPLLIEDGRLSMEVSHAHQRDDNYGPTAEYIKHCIGHEYEIRLQNDIIDLIIPFLGEKEQREKGFDKTPDIKLEVPINIDGCIINWIESKALFGDVDNHGAYLQDQLWSYWNRFGPGMVIYWFGYIDELKNNTRHSGILVADSFPSADKIKFYDPKWKKPADEGQEEQEAAAAAAAAAAAFDNLTIDSTSGEDEDSTTTATEKSDETDQGVSR